MQLRDLYTFIYRVEQKILGALSSNIVGYGTEVPKPDEEHPNEWEVTGIYKQIAPDIPYKEWIVMSKHDPERSLNQWFLIKDTETLDDYFEFDTREYILPHHKYIEWVCFSLRSAGYPQIAERLPGVIYDDEWVDDRDYDENDLISSEEIMIRLGIEDGNGELEDE